MTKNAIVIARQLTIRLRTVNPGSYASRSEGYDFRSCMGWWSDNELLKMKCMAKVDTAPKVKPAEARRSWFRHPAFVVRRMSSSSVHSDPTNAMAYDRTMKPGLNFCTSVT